MAAEQGESPFPRPTPLRRTPPRRPKRPSPSAKARQQQSNDLHPFAVTSSKVNFPGVDVAFNNGKLQRAVEASSSRRPSPDLDRSTCSSVGSSANNCNFSVDLSIGARAALDEHRRHVNKYGIDGTPSRRRTSSSRSPPDTVEDEWDRINDGNCSQVSWSTYVEEPSHATLLSLSQNHQQDLLGASDFFNSSRVRCLETPDRNKPIVDAASRLARLGEVGQVTERGLVYDESYVESCVGSNSGSGTGSAECDESGMAFLFHEAMRLNEDGTCTDQHSSFEASFRAGEADVSRLSKEDSNESRRWNDSSSSGGKASGGSTKDSFVESEGGVEFIADLSDIFPDHHQHNMTPSRNGRTRSDSYSTPQRGSRLRRPAKSPAGAEKENNAAEAFNLIALSPIASKAGSIAAKMLSSGAYDKYNDGTPARTPSRRTRRLSTHSGVLTPASTTLNRAAALMPQPVPTPNSFLNESAVSASTIGANNISTISPMVSPVPGGVDHGADQRPGHGSTCASDGDSSRGREFQATRKTTASRIPTFHERSRSDMTFDSHHNRGGPKMPIKSLSARYSRPDRFMDNFTPPPLLARSLSSTMSEQQYVSDCKSASRSLLKSFESSDF